MDNSCNRADIVSAVRVGERVVARARARGAAAQRVRRRRAARGARGGLAARGAQHQAVARHGGRPRRDQVAAHHGRRRAQHRQTVPHHGG